MRGHCLSQFVNEEKDHLRDRSITRAELTELFICYVRWNNNEKKAKKKLFIYECLFDKICKQGRGRERG